MSLWKSLLEASTEVYKELGCGHTEAVYHKALTIELQHREIKYDTEGTVPIMYRGHNAGFHRTDLIIEPNNENPLIVELKAITNDPGNPEFCQLRNYLICVGHKEGMLINFPLPSSSKSRPIPTEISAWKLQITDQNSFMVSRLTLP